MFTRVLGSGVLLSKLTNMLIALKNLAEDYKVKLAWTYYSSKLDIKIVFFFVFFQFIP
jgi:hypothetical protein